MRLALIVAAVVGYVLFPSRLSLALGLVGVTGLVHPLLAVAALGCAIVVVRGGPIRRGRGVDATSKRDAVLAIELVGLGVTSGLPFRNAASLTAKQITGSAGREVSQALRSVNAGQQPSFETSDIQSMFIAAQASETTGMPLAGILNAIATDRRREASAAARERLAKLPVKMLFPLALLILPGFVLLTVVPPLISGLSRLGI